MQFSHHYKCIFTATAKAHSYLCLIFVKLFGQPSSCLASKNNCIKEAYVGSHSLLLMFTNNYHRNCMHVQVKYVDRTAFSFGDLQEIYFYIVLTSSQALPCHQWVISLPVATLLPTRMYAFLLTRHPAHHFHFHTTFTTTRFLTDDSVWLQKTPHHTTMMRMEVTCT